MVQSVRHLVDAAFKDKSVTEILAAPPSALSGVSASDAALLKSTLGISTVRQLAEDVHFEAGRTIVAASGALGHDPGPPPAWAALFAAAPLAVYEQHPSGRFRKDFGPVFYRGRLDGTARLLLVGQDPSTDETLAGRGFVGLSGQRVQGLLKRIGITRSYVCANAFIYGITGQFDALMKAISLESNIRGFREDMLTAVVDGNPIQAVLAFGEGAQHAVEKWGGIAASKVVELVHPAAPDALVIASWNSQLPKLRTLVTPDEGGIVGPNYGATITEADHEAIPRFDLPFGMPSWHGTGGTRSMRDGAKKIVWQAP